MSGEAVLQVIYRDPRDLTPYKGNARTHSPEQIAQIAASIREFGFASPILLKDDETQIAGVYKNGKTVYAGVKLKF